MNVAIVLVLSACSIMYELLIGWSLTSIIDESVISYSLTIGVFVLFLGIGTFFSEKLKRKDYLSLYYVEIALSLSGVLTVFAIYAIHFLLWIYFKYTFENRILPLVLLSQSISALIGFLSGFEIPLLIEAFKNRGRSKAEGEVFAINYFGTLLGTLVFTFVLIPKLDIFTTSIVIGFVNLIMAAFLIYKSGHRSVRTIALIPIVLIIQIGLATQIENIEQLYLKNRYYNNPLVFEPKKIPEVFEHIKDKPEVEKWISPYQKINRVWVRDGINEVGEFEIYINGNVQINSHNYQYYHETFVHMPIQFNRNVPEEVLVIGAGDGLLIAELLKYKERIKRIKQVDIDPLMVGLAKEDSFMRAINRGAMSDPKVDVIVDDGFKFVRQTSEKFDAIYIDIPYPTNYDVIRLYSVEFYASIRRLLKKDGFLVQDLPSLRHDRDQLKFNSVVYNTFKSAGFESITPFIVYDFFLFAKIGDFSPSFEFQDLGILLSAMEKKWMGTAQEYANSFRPLETNINSIFHPTLLRLGDSGY